MGNWTSKCSLTFRKDEKIEQMKMFSSRRAVSRVKRRSSMWLETSGEDTAFRTSSSWKSQECHKTKRNLKKKKKKKETKREVAKREQTITSLTSWYIDGFDKDGIVKERSLLFPSLSTISCKTKKKAEEKRILQKPENKTLHLTKLSLVRLLYNGNLIYSSHFNNSFKTLKANICAL